MRVAGCSTEMFTLVIMAAYFPGWSDGGKHRREDSGVSASSDEQRLYRRLMKNYERSVRPVLNSTTPVRVNLGISLTQIFDMDERNQVLTVNVWLDQEWKDEKLTWNPEKYGQIEMIRLPCDSLWLPDIVLYNSVDDYTESYMRSLAMVASDGTVFWPPIVRFRSACKVDITYFPFDDQICHMKLGSWAYDGFQVDVSNRSGTVDLTNYIDNGEWELIDAKAVRNVMYYSCCPEPFPDVTFWLHIRRRTTYYTFNIIIPCMILSILTLASFLLPADSGEKVSLGLTVLLAFSVFMLLIAENMPATSEFVPLIGVYLTTIMALTSMSVILSVFVLHLHHRGERGSRAPSWMRKFALHYMARIMFIDRRYKPRWDDDTIVPGFGSLNEGFRPTSKAQPPRPSMFKVENGKLHSLNQNGKDVSVGVAGGGIAVGTAARIPAGGADATYHKLSQRTEQELLKYLQMLVAKQERKTREEQLVREWEDIAVVVDRLLFCLFLIVTFVSTISLLVLKPLHKDMALDKIH